MNSPDELGPLFDALRALRHGGGRACLVTLTRTRGATFRGVGTRMLVREDGSTVCDLSGGCPQKDIMTHAMDAMAVGMPRLVRYDAERGLDVLMEMGCGGELEVFLEPLDRTSDLAYVDVLANGLAERQGARLATAFACDGRAMVAQRAIWRGHELLYSNMTAASLQVAIEQVSASPERPSSIVTDTGGGRFDVLVEPLPPPHALVVIGSSTAAQALLPLAAMLGWSATLVDFDADRLRAVSVPPAVRTVCAQPAELTEAVPLDASTSVVVMTHSLHKDTEYVAALGGARLNYLGLLGARGRVKRIVDGAGLAGEAVYGPVGLDLGAESPTEIALAIIAEILAVARQRQGGSLRGLSGSIHR